jgi:rhodanese-related sulfurtransferase
MRILILTCLVLGLSAADGAFADIRHADLVAAIDAKKVVVIDVNGSESFKGGHITNAIDFQAAKADLAKSLPEDKSTLVVAYCGGPACGAWKKAASAVAALGYTNVKHYSAGISGWNEKTAATK